MASKRKSAFSIYSTTENDNKQENIKNLKIKNDQNEGNKKVVENNGKNHDDNKKQNKIIKPVIRRKNRRNHKKVLKIPKINNNDYLNLLINKEIKKPEKEDERVIIKTNGTKPVEMKDSREEGKKVLEKMIAPVSIAEFFEKYWEKKPLLIKRNQPDYYEDWFSCAEFEHILRNNDLQFTDNVDVTTYINGVKEKHNPVGKAYAPLVWDFFQQGCSIRFLNPHAYSENVWKYLSALQEFFLTSVGANTYLTPAGTQGFAPHYDDIEAFALQLEGKKRWRVYLPRNEEETFPRFSSRNFNQEEIGEPIIDCILEEGDCLYFPRGFIHQANSCDEIHSLHITVSCFQKTTFGDFLSKALSAGVEIAMESDKEFRKNLPIGYLDIGGFCYDNQEKNKRKKFIDKILELSKKIIENYLPIDEALDQFGKNYLEDSLRPYINKNEMSRSIHGSGEKWNEKKRQVDRISEIEPFTKIKLIKRNCIRLVSEGDSILLYYNMENSRIYQEKEVKYLEVEDDAVSAIQCLIKSYPKYISVDDLPMEDIEQKITIASCLYDKGLLVTKGKLDYAFDRDELSD